MTAAQFLTQPIRLLLIEPYPGAAAPVQTLLPVLSFPATLVSVGDLAAALQALDTKRFDLILLQLEQADEGGINDVQRLHAQPPHLPVIVLAGHTVAGFARQANQAGAADVLLAQEVSAPLLDRVIRYTVERRHAETALKAEGLAWAQRLQERTAELTLAVAELRRAAHHKDELLANVSHELRTPLTVVMMLSELIQTGSYGAVTEKQQRALTQIRTSSKQLLHLIENLLQVAAIEADAVEMQIACFPLPAMLQRVLQSVENHAQEKEVHLVVELDPAVTCFCGDERRLEQALVHLLDNAIKFTPSGGQVGLILSSDQHEKYVKFVIWDTGIGIAAADRERVFESFVRLEKTLTRRYSGTGLGLAIVRYVVRLHGGRIVLESEVGKGSRFTLILPWRQVAATPELLAGEQC